VDVDIERYFDSLSHDRLLQRVGERVADGRVLKLIEAFVRQDILSGLNRWTPLAGTPQGAVISPLLANIYLHPLDILMQAMGAKMVRYADDSVVMCASEAQARAVLACMKQWMARNGLTLHPDKTHVGDARVQGGGFEFLGYRFEAGRREVRKKSFKAVRAKIRDRTRRSRGDSLKTIIEDLNPLLRGWFNYFQHAAKPAFTLLDGFTRRRLRAILRKQEKRPGVGKCVADSKRWPNTFFAAQGLFTLTEAHALASQSR